jgi:hypothetical protein
MHSRCVIRDPRTPATEVCSHQPLPCLRTKVTEYPGDASPSSPRSHPCPYEQKPREPIAKAVTETPRERDHYLMT